MHGRSVGHDPGRASRAAPREMETEVIDLLADKALVATGVCARSCSARARALVALFLFAGLPLFAQDAKPRVSVAPLTFSLGVLEGDVRALSTLFETALVKSGAFTVVKQDEVSTLLAAQEASLRDYADRDSAVELGKILSASHIFVGTVAKLGGSFVASLQLVEVRTGRAVKAESEEATGPEAFGAMARRLAGLFAASDSPAGQTAQTTASPDSGTSTPRATASETERVRTYTAIGDRFLELRRYDAAIAQYEKARELAEFDVDVLWRIVTAMKQKLLAGTLYSPVAIDTGMDVALRNAPDYVGLDPAPGTDVLLERIYALQAIQPLLRDDVSLLMDEAQVLTVNGRIDDSRKVLRRAHLIEPENPLAEAELGLLESLAVTEPARARAGLDLIRSAVARSPETALFQLYLGRSIERVIGKPNADALRAYRSAAGLAVAQDFWTRRLRDFAEESMVREYTSLGPLSGGVLTDRLKLTVPERLEHIQYLVGRGVTFPDRTPIEYPEYYLAVLSVAVGNTAQAASVARAYLPADPGSWKTWHIPMLQLLEKVLDQTGADKAFLDTVRARLKELR
jgi:tetratricopeptide (TPR) repeat protein